MASVLRLESLQHLKHQMVLFQHHLTWKGLIAFVPTDIVDEKLLLLLLMKNSVKTCTWNPELLMLNASKMHPLSKISILKCQV